MTAPSQKPATMVIADEHPILRLGLTAVVSSRVGFEVVDSVSDVQEAIRSCSRHRPDVLLLDLVMRDQSVLPAVADLQRISPATQVVVFSAYCRDGLIEQALRTDVAGYLLKTEPPARIADALVRVLQGEKVYSEAVAQRLQSTNRHFHSRLQLLTPREIEVLGYIGRGWNNDRMAREMYLS